MPSLWRAARPATSSAAAGATGPTQRIAEGPGLAQEPQLLPSARHQRSRTPERKPAGVELTLPAAALRQPEGVRGPGQKDRIGLPVYMQALVVRLAPALYGDGWRRHDKRLIEIAGSNLRIFDKGSTARVKSVLDIGLDLESCLLVSDTILSLSVRCVPQGAQAQDGVLKHKAYQFDFTSPDLALKFHEALCSIASAPTSGASDTALRRGGA